MTCRGRVSGDTPNRSPLLPLFITFLIFMGFCLVGTAFGHDRIGATILLLSIPVGLVAMVWHEHWRATGHRGFSLQTGMLLFLGASILLGAVISILRDWRVPPWSLLTVILIAPVFLWIAAYLRVRRASKKAGTALLRATVMGALFIAVFACVFLVVQRYWGPEWALATIVGLQIIIATGTRLLHRRKQ